MKLLMFFFITACTIGLSACGLIQPYTITLNNNVLYNPAGAQAADAILADANLQGCLNQTLLENEIDTVQEVTLLSCPNSGVVSMVGIGALPNLTRLDLSGNSITDLSPLADLGNLRVLNLANNQIRSASTLSSLPLLSFVSLTGNDDLPCRQLGRVAERLGESLRLPTHCSAP